MRFFKKKDKRKNGSESGQGWMSSFGSSKHPDPGHCGYGLGDGRPDYSRPFGMPASASYDPRDYQQSRATRASAALLAQFPTQVLERIFTYVCPHSRDESYGTCEQSSVEDACMLCDLRDLAHCVAVCRRWKTEAVKLLYHSIRIDSVHYCELEAVLAERRKRQSSFFDRNGEPKDPAQARLKLLCRTLREDPVRRGRLVQYLKMPYMLRESCQADLARTIAVTPNLRYVDLPEGLFTDEPSFVTLRLEVQARCLELRKMTYMGGSENSLQALATGRVWVNLEVLELIRVEMEPSMLRQVLGCLGNLRALKVSETTSFSDETLAWSEALPPFPPVEELILTKVPNVTSDGIKELLVSPEARQALRVLTLNGTGVPVWSLQELVTYVPGLKHLSITDSVTAAMPTAAGSHHIPPLSSTSLESLHFEITAAPSTPKFSGITASYYNYLADSLLSGGLPNLRALYVRDPNFPDLLLGLPPPAPAYAEGRAARPASSGSASPFASRSSSQGQPLPVFAPPAAPFASHGGGPRGSLSSLNGFPAAGSSGPGPAPTPNPRFSSNNPFASAASMLPPAGGGFMNLPAKLEVFTKGEDDQLGWSFVQVGGGGGRRGPGFGGEGRGRRGRGGGDGDAGGRSERPLSSYGLAADVLGGSEAGWSSGAGARRSVLVGGAGAGGGFLAVPAAERRGAAGAHNLSRSVSGGVGGGWGNDDGMDGGVDEWPRPRSSAGEKKREKLDLWR